MVLKELSLTNFRNIRGLRLDFSDGVNLITGANGQGKTTLLEAVWLISCGKSFRALHEQELICRGESDASVTAVYHARRRDISCTLRLMADRPKQISLNGVPLRGARELVGGLYTVLFVPDHLSLVKDGAAVRRKFLDIAICQLRPGYLAGLSGCLRAIDQRNALLKDAAKYGRPLDTLDVWDENIARLGAPVLCARARFMEKLSVYARRIMDELAPGEPLQLRYSAAEHAADEEKAYSFLLGGLRCARKNDIATCATSVGPHRDDIIVELAGSSARRYASQGQQRSIVLSMKLAEQELLAEETGEEPLLLLDDILSELDPSRQDYVLNRIRGRQVLLTCCSTEGINLRDGQIITIEGGRAVQVRK